MAVDDIYTKALLHMNGADASTTFTDESGKAWTAYGNAQIDTAQSKLGGASGLFDGTGDVVSTSDSADFDFGSGTFTVDCWFKRAGGDGSRRFLFGQSNNTGSLFAYGLELDTTNRLVFTITTDGSGSTATQITSTSNFTGDTSWWHVAVVRTGNTLKLFVNGTQEGGDVTFSGTAYNSANNLSLGGAGEITALTWNGWLDEFRISKGVARWTANFTPPTTEYAPPSVATTILWS